MAMRMLGVKLSELRHAELTESSRGAGVSVSDFVRDELLPGPAWAKLLARRKAEGVDRALYKLAAAELERELTDDPTFPLPEKMLVGLDPEHLAEIANAYEAAWRCEGDWRLEQIPTGGEFERAGYTGFALLREGERITPDCVVGHTGPRGILPL
jgi:hypothetical protein